MNLSPTQKARLAILDHLLAEMGGGQANTTINVKVDVVSLTENGDDWTVIATTNAHTDRNYKVSYKANPGVTQVETYTVSSDVRYWDKKPEPKPELLQHPDYFANE